MISLNHNLRMDYKINILIFINHILLTIISIQIMSQLIINRIYFILRSNKIDSLIYHNMIILILIFSFKILFNKAKYIKERHLQNHLAIIKIFINNLILLIQKKTIK